MRRSRFSWALGALSPWCLGVGLVVSFTASAGIDATSGGIIAGLTSMPAPQPADIMPESGFTPVSVFNFGRSPTAAILTPASLRLGPEGEFRTVPDEIEPRTDLKSQARQFPTPDRTNKGDPSVGLRPTFDARMREGGGIEKVSAQSALLLGRDFLAFEGFQKDNAEDSTNVSEQPFTPHDESGATSSPSSGSATSGTGSVAQRLVSGARQRHFDGATPRVSRAEALSSNTPASADDMVLVVNAPMMLPGAVAAPATTVVDRSKSRPDYAALIEEAKSPAQRKCLAEAVYFESRSEPEAGQAAVAQVVLNRALSGLYPASVCGVVYQNRHRFKACQFSFACEGKSLRITDQSSWTTAVRIADEVIDGRTYLANVGGATHYHATYVRPGWSRRLEKASKIGTHIFYKLKPGQT